MPTETHQRRILLVRNPRSGSGDRRQLLRELQDRLIAVGYSVEVEDSLDHLAAVAAEPDFIANTHAIISAGGDGTVSAVASRVPAEVPIVLFPLGTENLLARWMGMKANVASTISALQQFKTRTIDAASANGKLSLIMIGVGYDAEVVHQVHSRRTGHITKWAYGWPIFYSAFDYPFPDLQITARQAAAVTSTATQASPLRPANEKWSVQNQPTVDAPSNDPDSVQWSAKWLFVANIPTYAGGMSIVPHARADDGYLCAGTFRNGYPLHGLWYAANIYLGRQSQLNDFRCLKAKHFTVTSCKPARFQIDGDDGGSLPLEVEVLPNRVTLVEPCTPDALV